jgi:NTP pyrophosphatase (non-canonical NTP hydrolase)
MRANEYQTRAMSTRLPSCGNAIYMLFGLMAEVGEIADKIAKWRRKGVCRLDMDHLVFNTGDLQEAEGYKSELMKEVGDCAWFIVGIADCFGFTLEEVMQQNLDKLASRRERGVIDGNGDNR